MVMHLAGIFFHVTSRQVKELLCPPPFLADLHHFLLKFYFTVKRVEGELPEAVVMTDTIIMLHLSDRTLQVLLFEYALKMKIRLDISHNTFSF